MLRAKRAALRSVQARDRPDAKSGLESLRIHDLLGTVATNIVRWGLGDEDSRVILGWKPDQVKEIRRRYWAIKPSAGRSRRGCVRMHRGRIL
jgi:hypothetical protein